MFLQLEFLIPTEIRHVFGTPRRPAERFVLPLGHASYRSTWLLNVAKRRGIWLQEMTRPWVTRTAFRKAQ